MMTWDEVLVLFGIAGIVYGFVSMWLLSVRESRFYAHLEKTDLTWQRRLDKYTDMQMHLLISENAWHEGSKIVD